MKIESKKLIGILVFTCSVFLGYSSTSAQGYTIVQNPNNKAFFGSSSYASNYYRILGYYTVENNPAAACYGFRSCYSVNYYYPDSNSFSYNYNYNNSNSYYPNNYPANNYYLNPSPVNVYSVPQVYWSNNNNNYGNNNYYNSYGY